MKVSVIYQWKNWCPGGVLSNRCCFSSLYSPRGGVIPTFLFHYFNQGEIKAPLLSSSSQDYFTEISAVLRKARRLAICTPLAPHPLSASLLQT